MPVTLNQNYSWIFMHLKIQMALFPLFSSLCPLGSLESADGYLSFCYLIKTIKRLEPLVKPSATYCKFTIHQIVLF